MKVLQVLPTLSAGGAEGFITNLGVNLHKFGIEVKFYLLAGARGDRGRVLLKKLNDSKIEVIGQKERNIKNLSNIFQLSKLIRTWQPDIVQANLHSAEVITALSRILCTKYQSQYIRRLANSDLFCGKSILFFKFLDRFFHQNITCAPEVENNYIQIMGNKIFNPPITIFNGGYLMDHVTTKEERDNARNHLNIPRNTKLILNIGRIAGGARKSHNLSTGQKGHDILLRSFAKAFARIQNVKLAIVGDGPLRSEAERLAKHLGVADQTLFLGQQPEPWPALHAADLFFFPSRHEGFPNALIEAASCGLPVIASNIPEIKFIAPPNTWLLKPVNNVDLFSNALIYIFKNYNDYSLRSKIAAKKIVKLYSMDICTEKYINVYQNIIYRNLK